MDEKLTKQEAINSLIEKFDFVRVHKAMIALNWEWYEIQSTPNIEQLKQHARKLLNDCYEENILQISSGGFVAKLTKHRENYLKLDFQLESSCVIYTN